MLIALNPQPFTETLPVRIWPDGTWAVVEDIRDGEYDWKSDDYQDVDLYDFDALDKLDPALRDEIVTEVIGPNPAG